MSEALELLHKGHGAFSRGDYDAMREVADEHVEWGASGKFPGLDVTYRGHDGLSEWMAALKDAWETFEVRLDEVVFDHGDRCGVVEELHGRGRTSGVEVTMPIFASYELTGGKLRRRRVYPDRAALEAVGQEFAPD